MVVGPEVDVIRWGAEEARLVPWRGSTKVALLTPTAGAPVPTVAFVRRCLDALGARGFTSVVTGALGPAEQRAFLAVGFSETERLHLLSHNLSGLRRATARDASLRRATDSDHGDVLAIDQSAFPAFWQLDTVSLNDALTATTHTRFRVVTDDATGRVVGYAISGRSGRNGYLQRLAVDPYQQGRGLGRWLVADGLRWLGRWRAQQCIVNTQWGNKAALGLYEHMGFRRLPQGLAVLTTGDRLVKDPAEAPW